MSDTLRFQYNEMNIWRISFVIFLTATLFLGCESKTSQQDKITNPSTPQSFQTVKIQDFPLISLVGERQLKMDAYSLHFSLEHPTELNAYPNNIIPWIDPTVFTESSGTFISYFRTNDPTRLDQPNIRLSYIRKQTEQPNVDALINWVETQFLKTPEAQKLESPTEVETASSKQAKCLEVYIPSQNGRSEKYMAFAYIDGSDDYMLGFNLTAIDEADFQQARSSFYELIKTYSE